MRLSLTTAALPLDDFAPIVKKADELGFESVWVADHLVIPGEISPEYPYQESGAFHLPPETPFADPMVMIGYLAAQTKQIRFGTGMFVLPLRNPFVVAKSVATAHLLSNERVILGVGMGWMKEEFAIVGEQFERRGARADEMVQVMQKLWTGKAVEHEGEWYNFPTLTMAPRLDNPPPFVFGGNSAAAIKRAARIGGGWYAPPMPVQAALELREKLAAALEAAGRSADDFPQWYRVPAPSSFEAMKELYDAGLDRLVVQMNNGLGMADRLKWLQEMADCRDRLVAKPANA